MIRKTGQVALAAAVFAAGLGLNLAPADLAAGEWIAPAQARVGRPLTPVSYAGVARRTTRRAVVATSAATAAAVAYSAPTTVVVAAPVPAGCVKVIDSYGGVTYRCP